MCHLLITRLEGAQEEDVPGLEVSSRTSKRNGMLRKQYKDIAFSLVIFFFLMIKTTTQAVWEKGQRSLCSISGPLQVSRSHSFHPRCFTLPSDAGPAAKHAVAFAVCFEMQSFRRESTE